MGVIKFAVKTSIIGGTIYYSTRELFWSKYDVKGKKVDELYVIPIPQIDKYIPQNIKEKIPTVPSTSDINNFCKQNWNKGVFISINFLSELPLHIYNGASKLYTLAAEYVEKTGKPLEKPQ